MSMGISLNHLPPTAPGPRRGPEPLATGTPPAEDVLHGELLEPAEPSEPGRTSPIPPTSRVQPSAAHTTGQLAVQAYRANLRPAATGHTLIDLLA